MYLRIMSLLSFIYVRHTPEPYRTAPTSVLLQYSPLFSEKDSPGTCFGPCQGSAGEMFLKRGSDIWALAFNKENLQGSGDKMALYDTEKHCWWQKMPEYPLLG